MSLTVDVQVALCRFVKAPNRFVNSWDNPYVLFSTHGEVYIGTKVDTFLTATFAYVSRTLGANRFMLTADYEYDIQNFSALRAYESALRILGVYDPHKPDP